MSDIKFVLSELVLKILTLDYFVIKKVIKSYTQKFEFKSILDLGCGTGYLSPLFPTSKYLGIDVDQKTLEYAKKNHNEYSYQVGNATNLNLKKNFDLILIIGVLHHLNSSQTADAIKVLRRHLSSEGRAIIVEAIPPISEWNILGQILRALDKGHFIRNSFEYEKIISKSLKIYKKELKRGGLFDYAVFFVGR